MRGASSSFMLLVASTLAAAAAAYHAPAPAVHACTRRRWAPPALALDAPTLALGVGTAVAQVAPLQPASQAHASFTHSPWPEHEARSLQVSRTSVVLAAAAAPSAHSQRPHRRSGIEALTAKGTKQLGVQLTGRSRRRRGCLRLPRWAFFVVGGTL